MSSILGTLWFVLLVGSCSFVAGAILRPWIGKYLPGSNCCKKG